MATEQADVLTSMQPNLLGAIPVRPTAFSRLQSYFPNHAPAIKNISLPTSPSQCPGFTKPRLLKVHIISWNMHDSFPKGNLEELLGRVPPYRSQAKGSTDTFPVFPEDDTHPYHIVVVAGQECPTTSGIPMGLGAGLKLYNGDKDRGRERGKEKEKDKTREEIVITERPRSRSKRDIMKHRKSEDEITYGWTAMVEDWLCKGKRRAFRDGLPMATNIGPPKPLLSPKEPREGPYELLVKERLMGIYMAIYVHRDIRQTIQGFSKSAVTAGLIGGRVGNKGGVGISLNVLGTTFLFINAHLAAHGNKINHRLANLAKIKAELTVDPFLPNDDPRVMAEDLTDKFDFTFIFGDLNFRLDITRLHADWLVSRKDYAQVLYFDQLRRVMNEGQAFVGFNEGPIDFPPTFKYDVLHTLKKNKSLASRHSYSFQVRNPTLQELPEEQRVWKKEEKDNDTTSIVSLRSVSSNSMSTSAGRQGNVSNSILPAPHIPVSIVNRSQTSLVVAAGRRGSQKRWFSFLLYNKLSRSILRNPRSIDPVENKLYPDPLASAPDFVPTTAINPSMPITSTLATSLTPEEQMELFDRGIYDSSHKRRVPSWCDRILWKSTLEPDPVEESPPSIGPSRSRFMQAFANAFRPFTTRPRSASQGSTLSKENMPLPKTPTLGIDNTFPIHKIAESHDSLPSSRPVVTVSGPQPPRRRANSVAIPPIATVPTERPARRATDGSAAHRSPTRSDFWRFLPSFLSSPQSDASAKDAPPSVASSASQPRKGDVICLSYRTLDDRGMRRLEGRSDHRPVIGTYAAYL